MQRASSVLRTRPDAPGGREGGRDPSSQVQLLPSLSRSLARSLPFPSLVFYIASHVTYPYTSLSFSATPLPSASFVPLHFPRHLSLRIFRVICPFASSASFAPDHIPVLRQRTFLGVPARGPFWLPPLRLGFDPNVTRISGRARASTLWPTSSEALLPRPHPTPPTLSPHPYQPTRPTHSPPAQHPTLPRILPHPRIGTRRALT